VSFRIAIDFRNGDKWFYIEQLAENSSLVDFSCTIAEYTDYLLEGSIRSRNDHVALTWLLRERSTNNLVAYMSLIADAIKLSLAEKELHKLDYPFKTLPAIKIAKLAVSQSAQEKYKGLGSYMINNAMTIALICNRQLLAARFLTVDADIEHDKGVLAFYEKNGFGLNAELHNKNRKTLSMRKDIYE
jgi:ribosomal protein S18 acetylase RimI-like enzyme